MLNFSTSPKKVLEIDFGSREKWPWSAGFGHTFDIMIHFLCECLHEEYFPIINDSTWWYGRWCDFFEPFWDEAEKQRLLQVESISIEKRDVNIPTLNQYAEIRNRQYIKDMYDVVAKEIFKYNLRLFEKFSQENTEQFDLAIHIRSGYEMKGIQPCRKSPIYDISGYLEKMEEIISTENIVFDKIFLLTDSSKVPGIIEAFFDKEVVSFCPQGCTGSVDDRSPENLELLLKEMDIAIKAKCFIGAKFSNIPNLINVFRNRENSYLF